jgi:hypothetical protein
MKLRNEAVQTVYGYERNPEFLAPNLQLKVCIRISSRYGTNCFRNL